MSESLCLLKAMRNPTDEMLLAFVKSEWGDHWEFAWGNQEREHCLSTWQAVVDVMIMKFIADSGRPKARIKKRAY